MEFIFHAREGNLEEEIQIDEMQPPESPLDMKLYSLMQAKNITEICVRRICKHTRRIAGFSHLFCKRGAEGATQ